MKLVYHNPSYTKYTKYVPIVLLTLLLFAGTCVSLLRTHAVSVTCANPKDKQYRVVPFDTLSTIAAKYNVPLATLEANNSKNIPNPDLIFPFQLVCIPSTNASTGTGTSSSTFPIPVLPKSPYVATAQLDAAAVGLNVQLFTNQMYEESHFVAFTTNGTPLTSPAGAIGIAQFTPATAASLGINPADPNVSLNAAAHLDRVYLTRYNGNIDEMLAAYNFGPGDANAGTGVAGAVARCGGVANFRSCLPAETEKYIHDITGN